ncbi:MAG: antitoxin Xre/MbcA/ParS toxin-binding domain-containing protein [Planctomycetota bacterium]|nr:antitoxin Xre/MbcA/ParS toxin-binding domain-containing protein [Planctomycetota bacterium]
MATTPNRGTRGRSGLEYVLEMPSLLQHNVVAEGFAYETVERLRGWVGLTLEEVSACVAVPMRTLARRKKEGRLDSHESDRVLRAARLFKATLALFEGDTDAARKWFHAPHRALGDMSPLALASTDVGAREVEALIGRLEHGVIG